MNRMSPELREMGYLRPFPPLKRGEPSPVPTHLHGDSTPGRAGGVRLRPQRLRHNGARIGTVDELTLSEVKPHFFRSNQTYSSCVPLETPQEMGTNIMKPSLLKLSTSQTLSSRFPHTYTYLQVGHSVFSFSGRVFYQYTHKCTVFHRRVKLYHRYKCQAIMRGLVQRRAVAPCS